MRYNEPVNQTAVEPTEAEMILESLNAVAEDNERLITVLESCLSPILRQVPTSKGESPTPRIADSTAPLIQRLIGIRNAVDRSNDRLRELINAKAI